jgi:phenylpyruvate tautomerase PptA (4-oxalocrotonate tautomerase family)
MMPRTQEVRNALSREITESVMKHCKVTAEHVWIVFEEPPKTSWCIAGKMAAES